MWFKNLMVYRLPADYKNSPEQLAHALEAHRAKPCATLEPFSLGWAPPLRGDSEQLVHAANGCQLICLCKEQRLLPAGVIKDALEERIANIEAGEARKVRAKERRNLRDDVTFELLPKAFTQKSYVYAYLSPADGWLIVDAAGAKKAEELLVTLGQSLGGLDIEPLRSEVSVSALMTKWLEGRDLPRGIAIQNDCELRDPADELSIVRCQRQDLSGEEIRVHLRAHKQAHKLALGFDERVSLILKSDLSMTRLRFESVDELDYHDLDDELARHDADFAFMTAEIKHLLDQLLPVIAGK